MTDKTTRDWIYRAMTELGRLYAGEAPLPEDYNTVEALCEPLAEQLNADEVIYIGDIDAIEPKCFLPLSRLLAIEAAPSFGNDAIQRLLTSTRADNLDALRAREYATLRRLTAAPPTYQSVETEYF